MTEPAAGSGGADGDRGELDFAALRRLGIKLAQGLAADSWTDFNIHDPGVTLLEQICYALTDLVYRTEFDVADHLTSPDGNIDFARLGLEPPERIFPCRPATATDYRRAILDAVPLVDDVIVRPMGRDGAGVALPGGLYQVLVRPHPGAEPGERARIRAEVERVCSRLRNLCEDVQEIAFVEECEFEIHALVEVGRSRDPGEMLAEIYHRCAEEVAAGVRPFPFEADRAAERSLDELLSGPLGQRGFFDEADLDQAGKIFSAADFFTLIKAIEGVAQVHELHFRIDGQVRRGSISAGAPGQVLRLHLPQGPDQIRIRLSSLGRSLEVPYESFLHSLRVYAPGGERAGAAGSDVRNLYTEPRGEYRDLRQYTSIQTQLPSVYGVGAGGLSETAPPKVRARSRQLKGYLLLFDQLMADCAAQLADLRELYARDGGSGGTYACQVLDGSQIAGLDGIYSPRPGAVLASLLARYDNVEDRRGRLLDYLLALYGESFSQNSLRNFDWYTPPEGRDRARVENRARFLRAIAELTRDRGAAADCRDSGRATVSGLQHRVSLLLGFVQAHPRALTAAFRDQGLRPVPEEGTAGPVRCDRADYRPPENPWEDEVPVLAEERPGAAGLSLSQLAEQAGSLVRGPDGEVEEGILRRGVSLANYRLGRVEGSEDWQAFLLPEGEGPWWRLGAFADRPRAVAAVNRLWQLIVRLNRGSEGMHLVEHILLRPENPAGEGQDGAPGADFFSFRLSVLFPAWTARCQDARFRQLTRETLRLNCPAHLVPEVIWLGFEEMLEFEQLQAEWQQARRGEESAAAGPDAAARLSGFLAERRGEACWALAPAFDADRAAGE